MIITANDLKVKGISSIQKAINADSVAFLSVRGNKKYAVIPIDEYNSFRETELSKAIKESEKDIKNGRFSIVEADEYISGLKKCLN